MEKIRILAIVLLFAVAANALLAGTCFMIDPSGGMMKAPVSMLRYSPFKDFLIPGIILFAVNGVFSAAAATVMICRWPYAALALIAQGILLTGWIIIQVLLLREFNILHAVFGSIGISFCLAGIFLQEKKRI